MAKLRGIKMSKDENDEQENSKMRAFETIEDRMQKRKNKASLSKLIMYIITLIFAILILLWLRGWQVR